MAAVDHIRFVARCPSCGGDAQWTETPSPTEGTARVAILVVCAACGNDPARIEGTVNGTRRLPEPDVAVTRYEVSCLPPDHSDRWHFTITVEQRSPGRWAVMERSWCIGRRGQRRYESNPSSRTDRFKAAYRFDLDTALAIAKREAPKLTVNGWTVEDILAGAIAPSVRRRPEAK